MDYSHAIGLVFGDLEVTGVASGPGVNRDHVLCRCACGNDKIARLSHLKSGSVKSCGCLLVRRPKEVHGTYLASRTPEYKTWDLMLRRCLRPAYAAYQLYGGRGITVCERWRGAEGFGHFLDDMGPRPEGASLDRIDNDGPYSPENCRWANRWTQANNRRTNKLFTARGETMTLADWARKVGISDNTIRERLKRGWSVEDAIHRPAIHR